MTGRVYPLFPLEQAVLLPGERVLLQSELPPRPGTLAEAARFGGVVAALSDGDTVHEVGVTGEIFEDTGELWLEGVSRCRLLGVVDAAVPLVEVAGFPEAPASSPARRLPGILQRRYRRLCRTLGRPAIPLPSELSALTWRITAELGLSPDEQQGFLNVPDPVTRGRLLLVAVRELERRYRFLAPWLHLRGGMEWN
jgi:Lon protease-like protein